MEIIKKGKNNQVECSCCGSLLEFDSSDISVECERPAMRNIEPDKYNHYYVTCPIKTCNEKISVTNQISNSMKRRVDERDKERSHGYI